MWSVVTECYNDLECWMYEMIRSLVTLEAKVVCWMLRVFFTNHANGTWTKVFFWNLWPFNPTKIISIAGMLPKKVKSLSWCYMDDMQAGSNLFRCCGSCLSDWQRQHRLTDAIASPRNSGSKAPEVQNEKPLCCSSLRSMCKRCFQGFGP